MQLADDANKLLSLRDFVGFVAKQTNFETCIFFLTWHMFHTYDRSCTLQYGSIKTHYLWDPFFSPHFQGEYLIPIISRALKWRRENELKKKNKH